MEYVTPRNVTNGSTSRNGVLCGSSPIVTSCNNRGIMGSGVFCWVHVMRTNRTSQSSRESNVNRVQRQLDAARVVWRRLGRRRSSTVVSRCVAMLSLVVRQTPVCEDVSPEAAEHALLEDVTQQRGEDKADWEELMRAVENCKLWELVTAIELIIVPIFKVSIKPTTNPNSIYSHKSCNNIFHPPTSRSS
jgi:hypothetical protein